MHPLDADARALDERLLAPEAQHEANRERSHPSRRLIHSRAHPLTCCDVYARLPPQGAGISLALVGCAGLIGLVCKAEFAGPFASVLPPLRSSMLVISAALQIIMVMRLFVTCNFIEIESLHLSSVHGALLVAIQLTLSQTPLFVPPSLAASATSAAIAGVLIGSLLQLAIYLHFMHHIIVYRARVEPFWTPVLLFLATLPLCGATLPLPSWVTLGGLGFGSLTTLLMWPPCVWRVLSRPSTAADPSIFMLMAPVPFITIGAFASGLADVMTDGALLALWTLNVFSVAVTLSGALQRRRALCASLCPMVPGWVALTFPLASNANVALRFWVAAAKSGRFLECPQAASLIAVYGAMMLCATAVLVPAVNVVWLLSVPRWLMWAPQPRPASMNVHVPPAGSGAAVRAALTRLLGLGSKEAQIASFISGVATRARESRNEQEHQEHGGVMA